MKHIETERVREAAASVLSRCATVPEVGLVLGSGLGGFAERISKTTRVPYADIPHMPVPTVAGHCGVLTLGELGGVRLACLQGRAHLYEGHPVDRVVFGVRLLATLGCSIVLLTNAAGALTTSLVPGGLLLLVDHLNLTGTNPLIGASGPEGPRFLDMSQVYDLELAGAARQAARDSGLKLEEGVYAGVVGPFYETPAEIRMLNALGAHAVGMSTVQEVLALRECGARVGAVSLITNRAAGLPGAILDHDHVQKVARAGGESLALLLTRWLEIVKRDCLDGKAAKQWQ